jgi:hypothetical protein
MTPIAENAQMVTDLDCQWHDLKNVLHFYPVPGNLVQITDKRLFDPRPMLPGSVIDESVADNAAILQSKLNLNGLMPTAWFQAIPDLDQPAILWAARGDQSELLVRKGALNGYAPVDDNRRIPPAYVTSGAGMGTVTEVLFGFPDLFNTEQTPAPSVSCTTTWKPVLNDTWFGVVDIGLGPQFQTIPIPDAVMPEIDAGKFVSGLFGPEVFPVAKFGPDHAPGIVPDPGETGNEDEYLARDMTYRQFASGQPYQPFVSDPTISVVSIVGDRVTVSISCKMPGSLLFSRTGAAFIERPNPATIVVPTGSFVEAYAAKEGYNNSAITGYTVPGPEIPVDLTSNLMEAPYGY